MVRARRAQAQVRGVGAGADVEGVARVEEREHLRVDETAHAEELRGELGEVVRAWAVGAVDAADRGGVVVRVAGGVGVEEVVIDAAARFGGEGEDGRFERLFGWRRGAERYGR